MATTKKSTKAKTKTPTPKNAKVKSVKTTKAAATTAPKNTKKAAKQVTNLSLRRILRLSTVVYAGLAVAAGMLIGSSTYQLTVGYLAKDELASKTTTVFAPAATVLYDLELRWLVVGLMVVSLIVPVLYLTRMERRYREALTARVVPWRWIDLAISSMLMLELLAILSGVQDIMTLKLVGGLMVITAALGWIAERQNQTVTKPVWNTYALSLFSGLLPWFLIAAYAAATPFHGMVRSPWYVYALYGVALAGFSLIAINQFNQHRRFKAWKDYMSVERNYLLTNLVTRVAFVVILIVGLQR